MEFQSIKNAIHYVFDTREEYDNHFLSQGIPAPKIVANWKEAKELDWVMSDDDRIIQILRRGSMKNTVRSPDKNKHASYYVRTVVGSFVVSNNQKMDTDFSSHEDRYNFGGKFRSWKERLLAREKNNKNEDAFVYFVAIIRDKPEVAYMKVYGTNNFIHAKRRAYVLMKLERIKLAIRQELKDIATTLEMDDKFHLEKVKEIIEDDEEKGNVRLSALQLSGKWTGMEEQEDPDLRPPSTEPEQLDSPEMQKRLLASDKSLKETKSINP